MATTLHDISQMLDAHGVRYRHHDDHTLVLLYEMEQYRNGEGDPALIDVFIGDRVRGLLLQAPEVMAGARA